MQMGINVEKVADEFSVRTSSIDGIITDFEGELTGRASFGYALDVNSNASVAIANKVMVAGGTGYKAKSTFEADGKTFTEGSFIVSGEKDVLERLASEYGITFTGVRSEPDADLVELHVPKVGLYKSWVANMDEGWTRFVMDDYAFDTDTLHDEDMRTADLSKYDAIIIPSQRASSILHGFTIQQMPEEYTGGLGLEGTLALDKYVKGGGTLLAFDEASDFIIEQFGLPLRDATAGASSNNFFIPGSLIRTVIHTDESLADGMQDTVAVSFNRSRAFTINTQSKYGEGGKEEIADAPEADVEVIATYAKDDLLMSGWAMGEKRYIADKPAMVKVAHGEGNVILYAFRPQFRAQPRGTYKLIFNALYEGAMK